MLSMFRFAIYQQYRRYEAEGLKGFTESKYGGNHRALTEAQEREILEQFEKAAEDSYSAIILPGGGGGTENMKRSPALIERLRRQKGEGGLICAICAAPTVLVKAGVLDPEQHITCYPSCVRELDRPCAEAPVVADGDVITGQAPGSALLFALVVLKSLVGDYMTRRVAEGMVTDVM